MILLHKFAKKVVYSLQAPNFCWLMSLTLVHHIVMPKSQPIYHEIIGVRVKLIGNPFILFCFLLLVGAYHLETPLFERTGPHIVTQFILL